MENRNTEVYVTAWASTALGLLSAIYASGLISEDHKNDIRSAVESAPDKIVIPAVLLRSVFMEV